jgi:hypothetical protein
MANPPPTLVSTFEVLFTPQLPPGLGPTAVAKVDEMVVKGYFLTISNPNDTAYTFTLGFHCNVNPNPVPAQRTLASAVGFLDDGTTGVPLTISPGSTPTEFSATITVSANGTVLVGVLPAFFTASGLASPVLECRGWVDITLPALFEEVGSGPFKFPERVAQSASPVNILLTPEQRLTFLPMTGDAASAVEAQSAFALPPASGQGAVQVPPQPGGFLILPASALAEPVSPHDLKALTEMVATAPPSQLSALLGTLVAASPATQPGGMSTEQALAILGFTA